MMIKTIVLHIFLLLSFSISNAQDDWGNYVIEKDKGIMAVTVNYKYMLSKPNYRNMVLVGTTTSNCSDNGAPNIDGLDDVYSFSDAVASVITKSSKKSRLVGILTYQCTGFDVYYVKDTLNIRSKIDSLFQKDFSDTKNYLVINYDKKWNYYKDVLYPKDESEDFFMGQDLLGQLFFEGVDLTEKRKVNHFLYFKKEKNRQDFIENIKASEFKVDDISFKKENDYPYELQLSRENELYPTYMAELAKILRVFSNANFGYYDGWGIE